MEITTERSSTMENNLAQDTMPQFVKVLENLARFLDKASQFADAKKIEFDVLLNSRLAPDQFPLTRQIQMSCDTAKLCASRLGGPEAPTFPDTEKTLPELRARIESTVAYLRSCKNSDFADYRSKRITQPRWEGKSLSGHDYLMQHALPNFYFHVTTAYAILRNNGVDVGKKDYLGPMPFGNA